MSAPPPLTVLVPVYNAAPYVADAIASVLAQSFGDFELLVIDDGSTDESLAVVRSLRDERIRIERNPENRGLIETLNLGIQMARGALLARMDADDLTHPQRFAEQVDYLGAHPDVAGVSCAFDVIDERGDRLADDLGLFRPTEPMAVRWALHYGCVFAHGGAMLRTDTVRRAGGFDPRYAHAEDYELWLRLVDEHRLANLPRILLSVREHGTKVSHRFHAIQQNSAHRALCASLARLLGREVPLELAKHVFRGSLPDTAAQTLAVASLQRELFVCLARGASAAQVRAMADDLAARLGVLAARTLRRQPWIAPVLALRAARSDLRGFARASIAGLCGDPNVYRRSPVFVPARAA